MTSFIADHGQPIGEHPDLVGVARVETPTQLACMRDARQVKRQIELFLDEGEPHRLTVALAILDRLGV